MSLVIMEHCINLARISKQIGEIVFHKLGAKFLLENMNWH